MANNASSSNFHFHLQQIANASSRNSQSWSVPGLQPAPQPAAPEKTWRYRTVTKRDLSYEFFLHAHPYVTQLMHRLMQESVAGLQRADTEYQRKSDGTVEKLPDEKNRPLLYEEIFSRERYNPSEIVKAPYPVKDLDFDGRGAYSVYNWELFFHVPMMIAVHLSKNQRFAEAQRWFHFIFDPTDNSDGPTPERFWKVRPFHYTEVHKLDEIFMNLALGKSEDLADTFKVDQRLLDETTRNIDAWKANPFRPHAVARGSGRRTA